MLKPDADRVSREKSVQDFHCPQCGHTSFFDPWTSTACCDHCGYAPPSHARLSSRQSRRPTGGHQVYLDEIVALWTGAFQADLSFRLDTLDEALAFFRRYRLAMAEDPGACFADRGRYLAGYEPKEREVVMFARAYAGIRRGDCAAAARELALLTTSCPGFVDPWIWLAAVADDPDQREQCLQHALALEPAHPLAQDAMAILRDRVKPVERGIGIRGFQHEVATANCPHCGGAMRYPVGAAEKTCPYCNRQVELQRANVIEGDSTFISDLRLKRRYQGQRWLEVERIIRCQGCGAQVNMTRHLAQTCLFCGSAHILVRDSHETFKPPNGFLPFATERSQASEAIDRAQRSGRRSVRRWITGARQHVHTLQGIYLPFWVFDGFVEVRTWAEDMLTSLASATIPPQSDLVMVDNVLVPAMDEPLGEMLQRVTPFETHAMVPYEPRLMADWPAALYNLDVEVAAERVHGEMIAIARRRAARPIALSSASSRPVRMKRAFQVSSKTYQLVLLPIWVALLKQGKELRLALVNGQTGRVVFDA